jgi:hypothetical protein
MVPRMLTACTDDEIIGAVPFDPQPYLSTHTASTGTCGSTCTIAGTQVIVIHDTTSEHTHHRCYATDFLNPTAGCTCLCCNDSDGTDCNVPSNYAPNAPVLATDCASQGNTNTVKWADDAGVCKEKSYTVSAGWGTQGTAGSGLNFPVTNSDWSTNSDKKKCDSAKGLKTFAVSDFVGAVPAIFAALSDGTDVTLSTTMATKVLCTAWCQETWETLRKESSILVTKRSCCQRNKVDNSCKLYWSPAGNQANWEDTTDGDLTSVRLTSQLSLAVEGVNIDWDPAAPAWE